MSEQAQQTPPSTANDYTDEPVYWFVILDTAVGRGDHATAATAQRELERLGVRVRYGRPRRRRKEVTDVTSC
jgi:hypothetical protein